MHYNISSHYYVCFGDFFDASQLLNDFVMLLKKSKHVISIPDI